MKLAVNAVALFGFGTLDTLNRTALLVEAVRLRRCGLSRLAYRGLRMTFVQPSTRSSKFL